MKMDNLRVIRNRTSLSVNADIGDGQEKELDGIYMQGSIQDRTENELRIAKGLFKLAQEVLISQDSDDEFKKWVCDRLKISVNEED